MISLEDIQVKYGSFVAIDKINFEVKEGEFFTLLGPSGCGKTTTLRCIAGFNPPSKGRVLFHNEDITQLPVEKREFGMVFQSYALFPTMTVRDNIAFGLKVDRWPAEKIDQRINELAKLVNLNEEQLAKNVSKLSGGQQQRVAIARALAKRPETVLFDEPLSNLDAKLRKQLRLELKRIQKETGMTAIYVTHDQEEALVLSDHIAVFNDGFIEQIGTPKEIYNHSATEFVCKFIGDANYLPPSFIEEINQKSDLKINPNNKNYIRQEKLHIGDMENKEERVACEGILRQKDFYGLYTTYSIEVNGEILRSVDKKLDFEDMELGSPVKFYLNPRNILSYSSIN